MSGKGKILIVDDERDLLDTLSFRLKSAGYDVITAQDGPNGIESAKEHTPNLIILDIMMPGIDGFEALKRLKDNDSTKAIPVIVVSCGREEEGWAKNSLTLGASGYMVKPLDSSALLFTVERFIKGQ